MQIYVHHMVQVLNFASMNRPLLIRNVRLVNEGRIMDTDILVRNGHLDKISSSISVKYAADEVEGLGKYLLPGLIDDQVHFREPGLTHKADIFSESRAAAAGGITSFMEMPNTIPQTLTLDLLQQKYDRAAQVSAVNYSFYLGVGTDNYDEIIRVNPDNVCGIKIFMGSSTGNMLVDDPEYLEKIFSTTPMLIAVHCEHEPTVRRDTERLKSEYGLNATAALHPQVRSAEACFPSSSFAVGLARKTGARLHVLHISTEKELSLFTGSRDAAFGHITAEACVHHLWFSEADYASKGNFIKWNPSIKTSGDRDALRKAVNSDVIEVVATDHAPHTQEEKMQHYWDAPSGGPLVQHALPALLELYHQGVFSLETIVRKTSHAVADCFAIRDRGYLREGYKADMVMVDLNAPWQVHKSNILYKCGWSPFEGNTFQSAVVNTWVNGNQVWSAAGINPQVLGERLQFNR